MKPNNQPMVEIDKEEVARRIREALGQEGKSPKGFANYAGISVQAVYKQRRTGEISMENMVKLESYTGKSAGHFLSRDKPFVRSQEKDLDYCVGLLEELLPPNEFPMPTIERLATARDMVRRYWKSDGTIDPKVIDFVRRLKDKYR